MMELSIHRPSMYDAYDFYVYEYGPGKTAFYLTIEKAKKDELPTFVRNEVKKGEIAKPIFRITGPLMASGQLHSFASTLVDWLCETFRVRPSMESQKEGKVHGKLIATELHLHDMRHLVYARHLTNEKGETREVKPPLGEKREL